MLQPHNNKNISGHVGGSKKKKKRRPSKSERRRRKIARNKELGKVNGESSVSVKGGNGKVHSNGSFDTSVAESSNTINVSMEKDMGKEKDMRGVISDSKFEECSTQRLEETEISFRGKLDLTKRNVEFVYPKSYTSEEKSRKIISIADKHEGSSGIPYIHKKLRKIENLNGKTNVRIENDGSTKACISKVSLERETIDEILYPNKKGRTQKISEEGGTVQNGQSYEKVVQQPTIDCYKETETSQHSDKEVDSESCKVEKSRGKGLTINSDGPHPSKSEAPSDGKKEALIRPVLTRQLSGLTVEDALKDKVGRRPRCNSTDGELNLPRGGLCEEHFVLESHKWDLDKLYGRKVML